MHSIRLRHPWQCEPIAEGCCWSRSFNWPAGRTSGEAIWLVVERLPDQAIVQLGGEPLTLDAQGRVDVTQSLAPVNRLTIELVDPAPEVPLECPFDVRLEIVAE